MFLAILPASPLLLQYPLSPLFFCSFSSPSGSPLRRRLGRCSAFGVACRFRSSLLAAFAALLLFCSFSFRSQAAAATPPSHRAVCCNYCDASAATAIAAKKSDGRSSLPVKEEHDEEKDEAATAGDSHASGASVAAIAASGLLAAAAAATARAAGVTAAASAALPQITAVLVAAIAATASATCAVLAAAAEAARAEFLATAEAAAGGRGDGGRKRNCLRHLSAFAAAVTCVEISLSSPRLLRPATGVRCPLVLPLLILFLLPSHAFSISLCISAAPVRRDSCNSYARQAELLFSWIKKFPFLNGDSIPAAATRAAACSSSSGKGREGRQGIVSAVFSSAAAAVKREEGNRGRGEDAGRGNGTAHEGRKEEKEGGGRLQKIAAGAPAAPPPRANPARAGRTACLCGAAEAAIAVGRRGAPALTAAAAERVRTGAAEKARRTFDGGAAAGVRWTVAAVAERTAAAERSTAEAQVAAARGVTAAAAATSGRAGAILGKLAAAARRSVAIAAAGQRAAAVVRRRAAAAKRGASAAFDRQAVAAATTAAAVGRPATGDRRDAPDFAAAAARKETAADEGRAPGHLNKKPRGGEAAAVLLTLATAGRVTAGEVQQQQLLSKASFLCFLPAAAGLLPQQSCVMDRRPTYSARAASLSGADSSLSPPAFTARASSAASPSLTWAATRQTSLRSSMRKSSDPPPLRWMHCSTAAAPAVAATRPAAPPVVPSAVPRLVAAGVPVAVAARVAAAPVTAAVAAATTADKTAAARAAPRTSAADGVLAASASAARTSVGAADSRVLQRRVVRAENPLVLRSDPAAAVSTTAGRVEAAPSAAEDGAVTAGVAAAASASCAPPLTAAATRAAASAEQVFVGPDRGGAAVAPRVSVKATRDPGPSVAVDCVAVDSAAVGSAAAGVFSRTATLPAAVAVATAGSPMTSAGAVGACATAARPDSPVENAAAASAGSAKQAWSSAPPAPAACCCCAAEASVNAPAAASAATPATTAAVTSAAASGGVAAAVIDFAAAIPTVSDGTTSVHPGFRAAPLPACAVTRFSAAATAPICRGEEVWRCATSEKTELQERQQQREQQQCQQEEWQQQQQPWQQQLLQQQEGQQEKHPEQEPPEREDWLQVQRRERQQLQRQQRELLEAFWKVLDAICIQLLQQIPAGKVPAPSDAAAEAEAATAEPEEEGEEGTAGKEDAAGAAREEEATLAAAGGGEETVRAADPVEETATTIGGGRSGRVGAPGSMSETAATEDVKEKQKCCRVIAVGSSSSGSRKSTRVGSTNNSMKEKGDEEEVEGGEKEIERGEKEEIKGEKRVGDRKGSVADVLLPWVLRFAGRKDFRCCVRESTSDKQERLSRGVGLGEKYGSSRRDDFLEEKNGTAARGRPGGGLAHGEVKATSHSVSHAKKTVSAIESHVARSSSSREGEGEEGGRRDRDAAGSSTRCDLSAREAAKKAAEATAAAGRAAQAEVAVAYNKCLVRRSGRKGRRKKSSRSVPSSDLSSDRCRRESSSCRAFPGSSGSSNSSSPTVVVASSTGSSLAVCSGVQGSCKNSVRSTKTSRRSSSSRGLSVCRPGGSSSSSKTSSKGSKQVTRLYKLTRCGRALASLETLFFQQHLGLQPPRMRGLLAHIDRLSDEGRIPAAAAAATADGPRAVAAADCGRAKSTADRKTRYPRGRREEEKEQGEQKEERADGKREAEEEDGRRDLRDKEKGGEEQPVEGKGKKDGFEGERKRRIDEESSVSDEAKTRLPARLHAARNSSSSSIAVGSSPSSSSSNSGSNCSRTSSSRSSSSSTAGEGSSSSSSGRRRRSARGSTPVNSIEAGVDCASSRCCSSSDPGHRSVTRSSRNSGTPGSSSSGTLEEGAATACYLGETKGGEKGLASVSEAEAYYSSGSLHVAATAAAAGKHWTRVLNSGKRGEDCENMDLFPPLSKKVLAAVEKLLERPPVGLLAVAVVAPRSAPLAASTAKQQRHQQHERQQKQLQQEQPQHHQRRKGSRKSQLRDTEETQGATQECGVEEEERFVLREEIQGEEATAKREVEQKGGGEDQKGGEGEEADEEEEGGQEEYEGNEEDDMDAQVLVVRPLQLDKEGARESGSRRLPAVMRKRSSSKFIRKSFSDAACSSWNGVAGDVQAGAVAAATATAAPTAAAPATARLHRTVPAGDRKGRSSEGSSPARAAVNAAAAAAAAGGKAAGAAAAVFQATAAAAAVPALRDTEELVADAESPKGNWKLDSKRGYAEERETFVWKPFPTALWLCGSELKKTISAVEGSGLTKQIEKEIRRSSSLQQHVLSDALRYIAMRWLLVDCSLLRHFYCMRRKAAAAEDEAVVSTENARKDEEEHGKGVEEEERPDMLAAAVQDSDAAAGAGTSSVAAAVADRKHLTWGETHSQGQVLQKATRKEQRSTCSSENSSGTSRGGRSEGSSRRSSSGSNGEGKSSSDSSSESKSSSSKYNSSMDCSAGGSSSSSGSSSVRLEAKDAEKEAAAASARRHVTAATKGSGRADAVMQPCCSCRICKSLQVLRVRGIGGVGDFFSVRCLHMHYAFHLLFPASAVGLLMERHLQKRRAAAANLDQRQQQQLRQERQQSSGGSSTGQAAEPIAGEAVAATVALKQQQTKTQACSTTAAAPTPAAAARESSEEDLHNSCSSGEERKLRTTRACSIRNHLAVEKEEHGLTAKGKLHEQSRETYSNRRR